MHQIITGADLTSSRQAHDLVSADRAYLSSTAGVHPHHAAGFDRALQPEFLELLARPGVVAVGECGLDYHRDLSPRAAQRDAFIAQLEMAIATGLPAFLHQRDAHDDFTAIMSDYAPRLSGAIAHCFTAGPAELETYLSLGLCIGVTGWVCDERRGTQLRQAVPRIPADRLMLETDAPYLLPRDLEPRPSSRRNEPAYLPHIARVVAHLRGEPWDLLVNATSANARRFFRL